MKRILMIIVALAVLLPLAVGGQTTVIDVTYTWTPPTTGSAVHHYDVQQSVDGAVWAPRADKSLVTAPTVTIPAPVGVVIMVRVRGVDAQDRVGIWSDASIPYTPDAGAPGGCGRPERRP